MTPDETLAEQSQVTQCPNCNIAFLISDEQLMVANGQVRCGSCLTIFQADQYWIAEPDQHQAASATAASSAQPAAPERSAATTPDAGGFELSDSFLDLAQAEEDAHSFEDYNQDSEEQVVANEEQWAKELLEEEEEQPQDKKAPRNEILSAILEQSAGETYSAAAIDPSRLRQDRSNDEELTPDTMESPEKWMQQVLGQEQEELTEPTEQLTDHSAGTQAVSPSSELPTHRAPLPQEPTEEYIPEIFRKAHATSHAPPIESSPPERTLISRLSSSQPALYCRSLIRAAWNWLSRISSFVAIGLASLMLALQITWSNTDQINQETALRPLIALFCQWTGCILPRQATPPPVAADHVAAYRQAPIPGIITIAATLHNTSTNPTTPLPPLRIELTDKQGRLIAARTFQPAEYLPEAIGTSSTIEPLTLALGRPQHLSLELIDPGANAVNYRLRLMGNQPELTYY